MKEKVLASKLLIIIIALTTKPINMGQTIRCGRKLLTILSKGVDLQNAKVIKQAERSVLRF
jgi:hypothetical protein